jgi:predicted ATP-grasp superfamily ATP-dependent carboligase
VDFINVGSEPVPLEVNPRYTAAMELVEAASGASLFAIHIQACAGRCPAAMRPWQGHYGKAIIYGNRPGTWRFVGDWAAAGIRDVPFPGEPLAAGRPLCTVLAQGATSDSCLVQLAARAAWVREECLDG